MKKSSESWYDYPKFWDMAFAKDTKPEADFIEAACRKYCDKPARRMLEPACGSGRLVYEMVRRGYELAGFDLSRPSLDYLRERLAKRGWTADIFEGDMTSYRLSRPVDAAFNTFSTFRHLLTEEAAVAHLQCTADALRPGGIYILGMHLLPPDADEHCIERWIAKRGNTRVTYTFRVTATDRRRRREHIRINMCVRNGEKVLRLTNEFDLRLYTAAQFRSLLRQVPSLELLDVYDYSHKIDEPLKLNNENSDTIAILRRR